MAVGISTTAVANPWLDMLRGVTPTPPAALWIKLHLGDPGGAGTASPSVVTTRIQATMTAASGAQITLASASGFFSMTATETITHISVWTASSGGTFLFSGALLSSRNVVNGDTLSPTALTVLIPSGSLAA